MRDAKIAFWRVLEPDVPVESVIFGREKFQTSFAPKALAAVIYRKCAKSVSFGGSSRDVVGKVGCAALPDFTKIKKISILSNKVNNTECQRKE